MHGNVPYINTDYSDFLGSNQRLNLLYDQGFEDPLSYTEQYLHLIIYELLFWTASYMLGAAASAHR